MVHILSPAGVFAKNIIGVPVWQKKGGAYREYMQQKVWPPVVFFLGSKRREESL